MQQPAWLVIVTGILIVLIGVVWLLSPSIPWLGKLPGDVVIERENVRFYFPVITCILYSLLFTVIVVVGAMQRFGFNTRSPRRTKPSEVPSDYGVAIMSYLSALLIVLAIPLSSIAHDTVKFKITTKQDNDQIEVKPEKDNVILVIRSPSGISDVVLERMDETWPDAVVLQLHLNGLESFKASNGKTPLNAAVLSSDGGIRLWKDENEDSVLNAESPYWMPIRIIGSDGKPTKVVPLRGGYFEIILPQKFFEENPKSIALKWIDFYRN